MTAEAHATAEPNLHVHSGRRPIPRLEGGLPFLGHARPFGRDPMAFLEEARRRLGNVFSFTVGGKDFVLYAGPEAHEAYFRASEDHLNAKRVYQFTVPIFGRGVAYDASREIMDEQLGFLFPALRESRMRTYAQKMHDEIVAYTDAWGDEGEIDLPVATNELTVNIAARCLLGDEIRERFDEDFAGHYHDLQAGINTIGFFLPRLPTPRHRRRDKARKAVARLISGILAERRRAGVDREDFMQTLMEARYKDGRALSDDEITGILLTVLFGGQHTSAVLAAWTGIELMQHPQHVGPIREEIDALYGDGEALTRQTLKKQEVLHRAVMECERMHPPLIMLMRKVLKPFEYDGMVAEAGSLAMVSPGIAHRMPEVFRDPHRFDPDRFAPPREEHKQATYTLIGFGGGKHKCIGMGFGYMQLEAIWTVLLDRFDFELATPAPKADYGTWVTGPEQPCRVRYRRRK
ncbi:MAG: cytochrome P450 [Myxococcota bacterium]